MNHRMSKKAPKPGAITQARGFTDAIRDKMWMICSLVRSRKCLPGCFQNLCALLLAVLGSITTASYASDDSGKTACVEDITIIFDSISSRDPFQFCEDFRSGWKFGINPGLSHDGILTTGTVLPLFGFRQPGWKRGDPNTLSFELVVHFPDVPNLFQVRFRDQDRTYSTSGKRTYFLWGRDVRTPIGNHGPYGSKWNPVRWIRCLTEAGHGCNTFYDVIICPDYRFPNWPNGSRSRFVEPIISVSADTPEASEDLLRNFALAHDLVEEALERLLNHTCIQGRTQSDK